jgi:photosystem II stability/assembly factor-like uncharacterized protein
MTDDLVEQLRARNPAPGPLAPPPIEDVLGRIAADERPAPPSWRQWVGPSIAIVVAAAVALLALVSLRGGHHAAQPAGHTHRHTLTITSIAGEAMRGSLHSPVLDFSPGGTGVIAWMQFRTARTIHPRSWLATTSDGGRSWNVGPRSFSLFAAPVFDGSHDGWTQVIDAHQTLRFYATHDGGRSWTPAESAAAADSVPGDVSVAGGVVWAVGTRSCAAGGCRWAVMRGAAGSDRLPATAVQPLPKTNQNATTISAGSATTAYVAAPARHGTVIYATRDGGQHWYRIRNPCSGASTVFGLSATSTDSLWQVCVRSKKFFAVRSTDGGFRWSSQPFPFIPLYAFEPVSSQVAWSQDVHGTIYRTADGGTSWQPVWRSGGPHGRANPGLSPVLSTQSAYDASVLVQLTHGSTSRDQAPRSTNLIVYRTSDGGRSWQPSVVNLPHG